ncbi:TIGR03086 family metal-binding protein [Sphaerisporangium perillae]|uniref:TIGR03086 family metal-binding protein n=1 Tax=Sphaerisporangium perillae TaxID=2935860 RepID=UPI00200E0775|nr:TIGR03086 family metal-binding protein [Sphaerisporangium perillae]
MDVRELDRRAVLASLDVVGKASPGDLGRPTPCAGWTLADLLAHMTAQHHGFAAAAAGNGADPEAWRLEPVGDDAVAVYAGAAERVIAAFAEEGVLDRVFALPEFGTGAAFPAAQAIGFHLIDYLVHAWDVARSLDVAFTPEPGLVEAAWPIAHAVPDDERRHRPGAAFQPRLAVPADATRFDQILAMLGRTPERSPAAGR